MALSLCAHERRKLSHLLDVSTRQPRDDDQNEWHFEQLPGTRIEGEVIAGMLGVPLWHGSGALEKHLKDRVSPRILHLATHGFFLRNQPFNPPTTGGCGDLAQRFLPIRRTRCCVVGSRLRGPITPLRPKSCRKRRRMAS